jgi:hypothetical protein
VLTPGEFPADQRAALDGAFWVVVVLGTALGTLGALWVGDRSAAGEVRS